MCCNGINWCTVGVSRTEAWILHWIQAHLTRWKSATKYCSLIYHWSDRDKYSHISTSQIWEQESLCEVPYHAEETCRISAFIHRTHIYIYIFMYIYIYIYIYSICTYIYILYIYTRHTHTPTLLWSEPLRQLHNYQSWTNSCYETHSQLQLLYAS